MPSTTLVIDNGSYTIKAGKTASGGCFIVPNCIARARDKRVLVGQQLENCRDFGSMAFRRPVEKVTRPPLTIVWGYMLTVFEKGYLVNWEAEKEIWDRTFLDPESRLRVYIFANYFEVVFPNKSIRSAMPKAQL